MHQHCIMQVKLEGGTKGNRLRSMLYVDLIGSQISFCCVCSSAWQNASAFKRSIQSCLLHLTSMMQLTGVLYKSLLPALQMYGTSLEYAACCAVAVSSEQQQLLRRLSSRAWGHN